MIVYQSTKTGFLNDASNGIEDIVREKVNEKLSIDIKVGSSEYNSWKNSLGDAMYKVMQSDKIPDDSGVAIEYSIPRTKNRIDFVITGEDDNGKEKVIIIELKQWTDIQKTDKDGVVLTRFKSGPSEEPHPSYQAWSYSTLLYGFNATVYEENIGLEPCAYRFCTMLVIIGLTQFALGDMLTIMGWKESANLPSLPSTFFMGGALMYILSNAWFVLYMVPITRKHQSLADRMANIRKHMQLLAFGYIWQQGDTMGNLVTTVVFPVALIANHIYGFIDADTLVFIVLSLIPFTISRESSEAVTDDTIGTLQPQN